MPRLDAAAGVCDDLGVTWIPVPPIPVARGQMSLGEGYHVCPESGDVRSPRGRVLVARPPGGQGGLAVHVWGHLRSGKRVLTCTTAARMIALGMLAAGLVNPPNDVTHTRRAVCRNARDGRPRWTSLGWQGRLSTAVAPLTLTAAGLALLGHPEPR